MDLQPVFIVGVPRSGTTWVQRLLAAHPKAWPLIETYMLSSRIGLGALLRSVPATPPAPGSHELPPPGLGRIFTRQELVAELRPVAERWLRLGSDDGARFVIEKSPWHVTDVEVISEVLPAARFVHVIRDGRDVAVSLLAARRSWSRFGSSRPREVLREAARTWSTGIEAGELARAIVGERLLELRYERLRADPAAACRELFEHCGMSFDQQLVGRAVATTRLDGGDRPSGPDRALRSGQVGEWRERFGIRDGWAFQRLAGDALEELGYERDRRWWMRRPLRSRL
jgi:hypothetical protein